MFAIALIFAPVCPRLFGGDDHNPVGVTGAFEGLIATGCAYNVVNHSATRQVDDIVVPGALGKYGLKMTRYYNSRRGVGDGWSHEYAWSSVNGKTSYPNGTVWDNHCTGDWGFGGPVGVSDWPTTWNGSPAFRLADGGTIVFGNPNWAVATKIIDPYGQITNITLDSNSGQITRVTEPGGRYLQFTYNASQKISRVDAYDGQGHQVDWVVYHYSAKAPGAGNPSVNCLTSVDYSDGTNAYYTYQEDNAPQHPGPPCPCSIKAFPLVRGFDDVRYHGAMRRIAYEYQGGGPHGAIISERYWNGIPGQEGNGVAVSSIDPPAPSPLDIDATFNRTYTETRGDGPMRTFTYTSLHLHRANEDLCPTWFPAMDPAPQQFLQSYTDFKGKTTHLGYDANWYVNSVRDANNNTVSYTRGPPPPAGIGQIMQIMYPGNVHTDYTFQPESGAIGGHYVTTVSNELQYATTYNRNGTTHQVYRIDYPDPGDYETFTYNDFGQVLNHRLRNGAYERFAHDSRGLLTDKWNPKQNAIPADNDPHIHYTYYTSGRWTDRVQTMTLPANWLGHIASETYEYDRALDTSGVTDPNGAPAAGRGLLTKITHGDGTYQSFTYDAYGNKRWEENELRKRTSYTYDNYNRVLTVKNALGKITQHTYLPTNGTGTSPYVHTTSSPDTITTPTGIVTRNVYDENFRKTSTTVADGTAVAATTRFDYDNVGNVTFLTDPRNYQTYNTYDARNRKVTATEAYGTSVARSTTWHYNAVSNIYQIDRPDFKIETKTYDEMNRLLTHTVPKTNTVNIVTTFDYNPSGTVNWVRDGENRQTYFSYDASDRKVTMTYPDNKTQQWLYDDAGNLEYRKTVSGQQEAFFYDIRNFKYANWWSTDWDNGIVDWCFFDHDAAGRLTEAENGTHGWNTNIISDVHRFYDDAGRLDHEQQMITGLGTKTVYYPSYDYDGRLTRMYVAGVSDYDYTYSYDQMGRFEKIIPTGSSTAFQYYYDPTSNEIQRRTLLSGVNIDKLTPRDGLNRIGRRDLQKNGQVFSAEAYTYDSMNRLTDVSFGSVSEHYGYYFDGEMNLAQYGIDHGNPARTVNYTLDNAGNRRTVIDNANGNATYTPNDINQYDTVTGCIISYGPEHEVSVFKGPNDPQQVGYTYINDERLAAVNIPPTNPTTTYNLCYDALGRCIKRTLSNAPTTYYVNDGEKPILEYDGSGNLVARNVYGKAIDEILMRKDSSVNGGAWFYYEDNHEGSITHLLNANGDKIESYKYDAFGAPTVYDGNGNLRTGGTAYNNRFLFTGREYAATYRGTYTPLFAFYEYRARAYSPQLGRFMSEDPKGFDAGDYNLFRYCHNDPVDLTDPMGTETNMTGFTPLNNPGANVDLTNAERISLWQKSMESSIGGEQAANKLQHSKALEMPYVEKKSPAGRYSSPRNYQEYLAQVRAIEGGNPALESPPFNPIDALSGWIAGLLRASVRSVAAEATATRAMWVGRDGELLARASGARLMTPSRAAVEAARAGDWTLMRAESRAWADGARGYVPVYWGNQGKGRIFLGDELPKLLNNMNSGKVDVIDITF